MPFPVIDIAPLIHGRTDEAHCKKIAQNDANERWKRPTAKPINFPDILNNTRAW